jgi:hypothetical protein
MCIPACILQSIPIDNMQSNCSAWSMLIFLGVTLQASMSITTQASNAAVALPSKAGAPAAVVLGMLPGSYQSFQSKLSAKLASEHPEMSWGLCKEVLSRCLANSDMSFQHHVRPASVVAEPASL